MCVFHCATDELTWVKLDTFSAHMTLCCSFSFMKPSFYYCVVADLMPPRPIGVPSQGHALGRGDGGAGFTGASETNTAEANGGDGEDDGSYYYYYYVPPESGGAGGAGYADQYSPAENDGEGGVDDEHVDEGGPAGYQEPTYGEGVGYYIPEANEFYYYYTDNERPAPETVLPPPEVMTPSRPVAGAAVLPAGSPDGTAVPTPVFCYDPPWRFDDVRLWKGSSKWSVGLCSAMCTNPCFCLGAALCPCWSTAAQRYRLLLRDWSHYSWCGGLCGACRWECCRGHGQCLLCLESTFCVCCAAHANRFMIMKHYGLQPTLCDRFITNTSCVCDAVDRATCTNSAPILCDVLYALVLPCMLSQQEEQMRAVPYCATTPQTLAMQ